MIIFNMFILLYEYLGLNFMIFQHLISGNDRGKGQRLIMI